MFNRANGGPHAGGAGRARSRRRTALLAATLAAAGVLAEAPWQGPGTVAAADSALVDTAACAANQLNANDDGSTTQVDIGFTVDFFGGVFSKLWVNNNGNVTFDGPLGTFTPFPLSTTSTKIIAPFFADVDTRGVGSGLVRYGYGTTIYEGHPAFCADWINVGYYGGHTDKLNSFQLLLVDRSDVAAGSFDIVFNYGNISWETGDASGGIGGLGGSSARAGYSNGVDRSFELPGSGTNGAFLDSNPVSGLVHNSHDSAQLGRYLFEVRGGTAETGHRLTGTVVNDSANPPSSVAGAFVSACGTDGSCLLTTTSASGAYSFGGLADGTYAVHVSPPGNQLAANATATIAGADVTLDLHVTGPVGPPAGTSISGPNGPMGGAIPVVYWGDPLTLTTTACAGALVSYTIVVDGSAVRSGVMAEGPAGVYRATVASFYPIHGDAHVAILIDGCGTAQLVGFDIYIDPSGVVHDAAGNPVAGATVTLLRSNVPTGPFTPVADGSNVMSAGNRANPDTTGTDGRFGWDVIPGYYVVRAERAGCQAPDGSPSVQTDVLPVPPPALDLSLELDCGGTGGTDTTPPTVSCGAADGAWHAGDVSVPCTASDDDSGLADAADAAFELTTAVAAGEETADAATGSRQVCDVAGNCTVAGPIGGNHVDRKAPVATCGSADTAWHASDVTVPCTAADGGSGLANAADASFGLMTAVAAGTETADAATGSRQVCDVAGNCTVAGPISGNHVDRKAPVVTPPAAITANATSPAGGTVTYAATATDGTDPAPALVCAPASGTPFAIGTTTVSCTATDHAGNTANATFPVRVLGAPEQIVNLTNLLRSGLNRPALSDQMAASLQQTAAYLVQHKPAAACVVMALLAVAIANTPARYLAPSVAAQALADARRIIAVIGC